MIQNWIIASKKERLVHILMYLSGAILTPIGSVLMINSHFGAGGIDAFNFALGDALHIPTTFIIYMTQTGFFILAAVIRRAKPAPTAFFCFATILIQGAATGLWKVVFRNIEGANWTSSFLLFLIGILIVAITAAPYFVSIFPSGPTDDYIRALIERGVRVSIAKLSLEAVMAFLGWMLHGEVSIGTLLVVILLGPLLDICQIPLKKFLKKQGIRTELELSAESKAKPAGA